LKKGRKGNLGLPVFQKKKKTREKTVYRQQEERKRLTKYLLSTKTKKREIFRLHEKEKKNTRRSTASGKMEKLRFFSETAKKGKKITQVPH